MISLPMDGIILLAAVSMGPAFGNTTMAGDPPTMTNLLEGDCPALCAGCSGESEHRNEDDEPAGWGGEEHGCATSSGGNAFEQCVKWHNCSQTAVPEALPIDFGQLIGLTVASSSERGPRSMTAFNEYRGVIQVFDCRGLVVAQYSILTDPRATAVAVTAAAM